MQNIKAKIQELTILLTLTFMLLIILVILATVTNPYPAAAMPPI